MPFIHARITVKLSEDEKTALSRMLALVLEKELQKPAPNTMIAIDDGAPLILGEPLEKGAYIDVRIRGAGSKVKFCAMTEAILSHLETHLSIPPKNVDITYQSIDHWAARGGYLP